MHCFVCEAEYESKNIIVALLGCPSQKDLWRDTEKLISGIFARADRSVDLQQRVDKLD
jgi:D-alanyl-D-alanine carboxypeptidase